MHHVLKLILLLGVPESETRLGPQISLVAWIAAHRDRNEVIFFELAHTAEDVFRRKLPVLQLRRVPTRRSHCAAVARNADRLVDVRLRHGRVDYAGCASVRE